MPIVFPRRNNYSASCPESLSMMGSQNVGNYTHFVISQCQFEL